MHLPSRQDINNISYRTQVDARVLSLYLIETSCSPWSFCKNHVTYLATKGTSTIFTEVLTKGWISASKQSLPSSPDL